MMCERVIGTLGPYAVALSKVINDLQQYREDRIMGPIQCFAGIAIPSHIISKWEQQKYLTLDGYRSTSLDE